MCILFPFFLQQNINLYWNHVFKVIAIEHKKKLIFDLFFWIRTYSLGGTESQNFFFEILNIFWKQNTITTGERNKRSDLCSSHRQILGSRCLFLDLSIIWKVEGLHFNASNLRRIECNTSYGWRIAFIILRRFEGSFEILLSFEGLQFQSFNHSKDCI